MCKRRVILANVLMAVVAAAAFGQTDVVSVTTGEKRDSDPMVSPNGKHLAFASNRTGNFDIYVLTFGQAGISQLTQSKEDDRYPNWSGDSKKIVFNSKRTGTGDLYEMSVDGGSGYLQLTSREDIDEYASYASKGDGLLFATCPKKMIQVRPKMSVVYAEEKGRADSARVLAEGDEARFSSDGKKIIFVSARTKNDDIWIMNSDGGMQTQLTTDPKDDRNPCFSPDGKRVIFASRRTGNFDLWVMDADGGNVRQLTTDPRDETQPCWSSGGYLYYTHKKSETQSNIHRIKAP
ncbi:MAG: PD40 domain-containing protein [Candidatus Hydrogenedentes bacterium]|nr:PD40 domain-containing protein [Candidatus Hydrogenedentota bacterium]